MLVSKFHKISKKGLIRGNRFSTNTNYKFSKFHKIQPRTSKRFTLSSSSFFMISCPIFIVSHSMADFTYFSDSQLKSFRLSFRKPYSKLFHLHVRPYFGISKRPAEVRMGKGKSGKISYRAYPFRPGTYVGFVPSRSSPSLTSVRSLIKMFHPSSKLPFRSWVSDMVFLY